MAPDLRRRVDANRAARLAMEDAAKQQAVAQVSSFCLLCVTALSTTTFFPADKVLRP